MKRISIVAVLALFSAIASAGCLGQTSATEEGTDESKVVSERTHEVANGEPQAVSAGGPAQSLELDIHPNGEVQGPHPEPWLDQEGPHPEPWTGRAILIGTDPDPNANNGSKP